MEEFKPGQVIVPRSAADATSTSPAPMPAGGSPEPVRPPETTPSEPPAPSTGPEPNQAVEAITPPANDWQFHSEAASTQPYSASPAALQQPEEISWTASEFIAHEKSPLWYALLVGGGALLAIVIYFLTKDKLTTGIIVLCGVALGIFAARKPNIQNYSLNDFGLQIGQKIYAFHDYKSFTISEDGAIASIVFMPLKRFMPPLTIYVAPELEDKVVDFLGNLLPFAQIKPDAVDSLLRRIRF